MHDTDINADIRERVWVDTAAMDWAPSPSGAVWRKRVHLVGPPESGKVTSVVRYEPGATFPGHDHPGGEEIFVWEGTFSDEHGDWPAGTYLLNPEGFRHAPYSSEGCLLFVKLRQYAGADRIHVCIQTATLPWSPTTETGVEAKHLYSQSGRRDTVRLERWTAGARLHERSYPAGVEYFVLEGSFEDQCGAYRAGTWLRLPRGSRQRPFTSEGCILYAKRAGLPDL